MHVSFTEEGLKRDTPSVRMTHKCFLFVLLQEQLVWCAVNQINNVIQSVCAAS